MNNPNVFANPCAICKRQEAVKLCDYVLKYDNSIIFVRNYKTFKELNSPGFKHETCDLPICDQCAKNVGHHVDFCPHHYKVHQEAALPKELERKRFKYRSRMFNGAD